MFLPNNQWIDVSKELPPMGRPVLAVAKKYGGRDHWLCAALRRGNAEDWIWAVSNGEHNDRLLEGKDYFVCDTYEAKLLILTQFFSLSQDIQKAGPTRGASDHKIVG